MNLFLMRHGDASAAPRGGSDGDRPLTTKGRSETREIASMLSTRGASIDAILTSPLVRAVQTGEVLSQALTLSGPVGVLVQLASGCSPSEFFDSIPEAPKGIVLVGHLPSIQSYAEWILGRPLPAFGKSSVVGIELPQGQTRGRFLWMLTPGSAPILTLP